MLNLKDSFNKNILAGLYFILVFILFMYSVQLRLPLNNKNIEYTNNWSTLSTTKFAKNWYREGAWKLRFTMFEEPRSVEFPREQDRKVYMSYPPGAVIPVHLYALLKGAELNPLDVQRINLLLQGFISIILGLYVYWLLEWLALPLRWLAAAVSSSIYILSPLGLTWHFLGYFSDQAVLFYYALVLLLEVLRDRKNYPVTEVLQSVIIFGGVFTDWLMIFVCGILFVKRLALRSHKKPWEDFVQIFLPAVLALGLFGLQLTYRHQWGTLFERFVERTGISTQQSTHRPMKEYLNYFVGQFECLSILLGLLVVGIGVLILRVNKNISFKKEAELQGLHTLLIILPGLMHFLVFRQHSLAHEFSTLKFAIPLSLIPLVQAPVFLFKILNLENKRILSGSALMGVSLLITLIYLYRAPHHFLWVFHQNSRFQENVELPKWVAKNSQYNDVFISTFFNCPAEPTFCITHSMKRIWRVNRFQDIYDLFTKVEGKNSSDSLRFKLIIPVKSPCKANPILKELPGKVVELDTYQFVLLDISADWLKRKSTQTELMLSKLCAD